jgi:hypothetical protein
MMRTLSFALLFGFSLILIGCNGKNGATGPAGSSATNAIQASFQNGVYPTSSYSGELDTWLNGGNGSPMNASPYLEINTGANVSNYGRILVYFNITSLPANATIVAADLLLTTESSINVGSSAITIGLHNLASDTDSGCHWTEAATWITNGLSSWSACTGDSSGQQEGYINPTSMSTVVLTSANNGLSQIFKWSITPSVIQSWLASTVNNNGLILKSEGEFGETASAVGFYPYNGTTGNGAQLIVQYE